METDLTNKKIMNYLLFIYILIFALSGCKNPRFEHCKDIQQVTKYFMDSLVSKATHGDNYIIYPIYNARLTIDDFRHISETEQFKDNAEHLLNQYDKMISLRIQDNFDDKYLHKFKKKDPERGQVLYEMAPPLFSLDNKYCILYSRTVFWVGEELKWDDLHFIFERNSKAWKHYAFMKRTLSGP